MMYPVGTGGQQQRASFGHDASGWEEGHSDRHSHSTSVPLTTVPHNSLGTEGGRVVFKVRLGTDIRRIPLNNEDLTYNEFILMMQRIFRGKLSSSDEIVVKYKDEDGDLITIVDDPDLAFAMQTHKTLKLVLLVNGDTGVVGQPKGGESTGESNDLMEAVRELQNKLAEIPASLEQGFQRVMEKVLSERSGVSPEKGDKGGRSGVDHQRTEQIPAAKTAKFPSAVENGFDELSLRGVADGQQTQEQLRHEMDVEQSGSVRIGEQKEVPAPAQHPQHGMLQGQHGQPAQQQPNVHQFPSQAHGQQQPYGQQPQHQMQQQQLMQQQAAQQHAAQQHAAQQQAAQQQAAQQQAAQQQAAQQQAAQQQAAQHQHHLMQQQLQQQQLQQQQQQSPQQQQQALGAQLKAQYSFPPPAGAPPMPQQMGQGGPPPGGMSRPPSQPQMPQNPGQPVGPPPMMGGPGQFPPGGNPYARPPGVSPMGPPPPGFQSGMFQGQPPQSYGAQFMQPPPK